MPAWAVAATLFICHPGGQCSSHQGGAEKRDCGSQHHLWSPQNGGEITIRVQCSGASRKR